MCLESDGTIVEDDEVLTSLNEPLLLIGNQHQYLACNSPCLSSFSGSTSISESTVEEEAENSTTIQDNYLPVVVVSDSSTNTDNINTSININVGSLRSEYSWHTFPIPWGKIPDFMLENLREGRPQKSHLSQMVHVIVNEMRGITTNIPYKAFRIIAKKMCDKYPKAFIDRDEDGTVLGDGMHSLVSKLHIRNTYLNRPHKSTKKNDGELVRPKKLKQMNNMRAGCSNWQPTIDSVNLSHISSELQIMDENNENFFPYLEKTYAQQRCFINQPVPPSVNDIKKEWPMLLNNKTGIYWHFQKLMNIDIKSISLDLKTQKIVDFNKEKKLCGEEPDLTLYALKIIAKYFKEDIDQILYVFKVSCHCSYLILEKGHYVTVS